MLERIKQIKRPDVVTSATVTAGVAAGAGALALTEHVAGGPVASLVAAVDEPVMLAAWAAAYRHQLADAFRHYFSRNHLRRTLAHTGVGIAGVTAAVVGYKVPEAGSVINPLLGGLMGGDAFRRAGRGARNLIDMGKIHSAIQEGTIDTTNPMESRLKPELHPEKTLFMNPHHNRHTSSRPETPRSPARPHLVSVYPSNNLNGRILVPAR